MLSLILAFQVFSQAEITPFYAAHRSTEAIVRYETRFLIEQSRKPSTAQAQEWVQTHVQHLFGPISASRTAAAPKEDHEISKIQISKQGPRIFEISYAYQGTFVVASEARNTLTLILPLNLSTIYERGIVRNSRGTETYPCTDEHYPTEGDFWYFWNPDQSGCPLVEGEDYVRLSVKLERLPNTKLTYPEYPRLIQKDGVIRVSLFVGMDEPKKNSNDPLKSKDANAYTYREIRKALLDSGYESTAKTSLTETMVGTFDRAPIEVTLFFGATGIDEASAPFHRLYKKALESASLVLYDGHSGLGGHLDLAAIESERGFKIKLPQDRYQIYVFNSCSSYPYFNKSYLARKPQNIEILTHGLVTYMSDGPRFNLLILRAIEAWAKREKTLSYQQIAQAAGPDSLFGVNGDEDNPTQMEEVETP